MLTGDVLDWLWDALNVLGAVWFGVLLLLLLGSGAVVAGQSFFRWKRERSENSRH